MLAGKPQLDVTIMLTTGQILEFRVDLGSDEWKRRFERALRRRRPITVRRADGEVLAINPARVVFMRYRTAGDRPHDAMSRDEWIVLGYEDRVANPCGREPSTGERVEDDRTG